MQRKLIRKYLYMNAPSWGVFHDLMDQYDMTQSDLFDYLLTIATTAGDHIDRSNTKPAISKV